MLLAGKYFIVDWIQSPVVQWDRSTEQFRCLEWAFGEALDVEDVKMHIFVISCEDVWWYLVHSD